MPQIIIKVTEDERVWMREISDKLNTSLTFTIVQLLRNLSRGLGIPIPEDITPMRLRKRSKKDHQYEKDVDARWKAHLRNLEKRDSEA